MVNGHELSSQQPIWLGSTIDRPVLYNDTLMMVMANNGSSRRCRLLGPSSKRFLRCCLVTIAWSISCILYWNTIFISALVGQHHHKCNNANSPKTLVDQYVLYWDHLLLEEHLETTQLLRECRLKWSSQRLEDQGLAISYAYAEPESEILGEKTVRIVANSPMTSNKRQKPWKDSFGRGDILEMTSLGSNHLGRIPASSSPPGSFPPRECLVMDAGDDWMIVGVGPTWPSGMWETRKYPQGFPVRLDRQIGPDAPLKAQRSALQQLRTGSDQQASFAAYLLASLWSASNSSMSVPSCVSWNEERDGTSFAETAASQIPHYLLPLIESQSEFFKSSESSVYPEIDLVLQESLRIAMAKQKDEAVDGSQQRNSSSSFTANKSQQEAIIWALQRRISLIRGPPGTGKSSTAALLIATALEVQKQLLFRRNQQGSSEQQQIPVRVLAVAHSNGAADVLLKALLEVGVPAVRLGRPASVSPDVHHRTIAALAERMPSVKRLRQDILASTGIHGSTFQWELKQCIQDAHSILLRSASVVVTSCIGAHQIVEQLTYDPDSHKSHFPIVVLDEAAQCTEPALVCALVSAGAQQVVQLGDTQQLPPTVTSSLKLLREALGTSPMSRLEAAGVNQRTLQLQYRMSPVLLEHPSKYFYNGMVRTAEFVTASRSKLFPPRGFSWPNADKPLAFLQIGNGDAEIPHTMGGRSNPTEAKLIADLVAGLLLGGEVSESNIAVLTPYSKQVQAIRTALADRSIRQRNQNDTSFSRSKDGNPLKSMSHVRVGTVDSFQGQETEVVIISAVRSNTQSELGFLRDRRRLCVAITRARRAIIIVGDSTVLGNCRHWEALIQSCKERGCFVTDDVEIIEQAAFNESMDNTVKSNFDTEIPIYAASTSKGLKIDLNVPILFPLANTSDIASCL